MQIVLERFAVLDVFGGDPNDQPIVLSFSNFGEVVIEIECDKI